MDPAAGGAHVRAPDDVRAPDPVRPPRQRHVRPRPAGGARGADGRHAGGARRGRERARRPARRDRGHRARLPVRGHAPGAGELALLFCPIPRITAAPDYPWAHDPDRRETFITRTVDGWGEGVTVDAVSTAFAGDPGLRDWFARMERLALGPAAIEPTMRVVGRTDVRDILALIRVPTLVMRRRDDSRVDRRHAEYVRDRVPGARFVELPGTETRAVPRRGRAGRRRGGGARDRRARRAAARARARHRPVHGHRRLDRAGLARSATAAGASCSTAITRSCAPRSPATAARRSRRSATASSPPSTALPARCAARSRSPSARAPPASRCAPGSTPASASASAPTWPASPCTSPRACWARRARGRCWSRAP